MAGVHSKKIFVIVFSLLITFAITPETPHATKLIKPSFFASPQSVCALNALHSPEDQGTHGIKTAVSIVYSKNFSNEYLGTGLGPANSNTFSITTEDLKGEVNSDYLIAIQTKHENPYLATINETLHRPQATLTFAPEQQEAGINFIFHHDLNVPLDDSFYRLEVNLVHQKRSLNATYTQEKITQTALSDIISIKDFFNGSEQSISYGLSYLKIPQEPQTKAHVDLVQFTAGNHLINTDDYRFTLFGSAQLPCGPEDSNDYLFSPQVGTKHLQLGVGCDAQFKLAHTTTVRWDISNTVIGGYSFPKNEPRIPTIAGLPWGHYHQVLRNESPSFEALRPGVNELPRSLKVRHGLSLQNVAILSYQHNTTTIHCGFSAGYREAEHNIPANPWKDNAVGITNKYLNPLNYTGASNNPAEPIFYVDGRMYPRTAGVLPETTGDATFFAGARELTPLTSGARAQNMCKKVINNQDLDLNHPTLFYYQLFASFGQKITLSNNNHLFINSACQISFGTPKELVVRSYQLSVSIGCNF